MGFGIRRSFRPHLLVKQGTYTNLGLLLFKSEDMGTSDQELLGGTTDTALVKGLGSGSGAPRSRLSGSTGTRLALGASTGP